MEKKIFKRIGVLTSGGDAPGMNAAVRSVVRTALKNGVEVVGIKGGYRGLLENDMQILGPHDVSNVINEGGTFLYTDRCLEFKEESGMQKALKVAAEQGLDGIVCIGGDGTFRGAQDLSRRGVPCIGITGTIDNDVSSSDYTVGFDTAMNTVVEMVDRLRDTCESHARCNVVEVMGRDAGYIAVNTAIATGATGCAVKELPFDEDALIEKIKLAKTYGKRNFIVIVSEGMPDGFGEALAKKIQAETEVETKFARLAHVQRGGRPTLRDRVSASKMGEHAVQLLLDGKSNLVVVEREGKIVSRDIEWALMYDKVYKGKAKPEDIAKLDPKVYEGMVELANAKHAEFEDLYRLANSISI
ncbi:MAG: 6-phosphofructokinase [Clostridia bacterium]|nr:6-phosphofructokinase [Clostridia bacterium]